MFQRLYDQWEQFKARPPGRRFTLAYKENRRGRRSGFGRVARLALGVVVSLIGIVLMPAPGPGMLVVVLGLGLLAHESLTIARLLDAAELRLRPRVLAMLGWWRNRSRGARVGLIVLMLIIAAAAGSAGLYWMAS